MASNSRNLSKLANKLDVGVNYEVEFPTEVEILSLGVGVAASNTSGEIRATGDITGFFSSDETLKENVQEIPDALNIVVTVGGKTFDWKDSYVENHGGADGYFLQKEDFGVIAQDVQKVFPKAVRVRQDGTLAVDYSKMVAIAFQAIKEQQEIIKKHEELINKLLDK
jgi:hypothetical protein